MSTEQDVLDRMRKYAERYGFRFYQTNLEIPEEWVPVVLELDEALAKLDPDYEIVQVKIKFNDLRYYANTTLTGDDAKKFNDLIAAAETKCYKMGLE